MNRGDFIKLDYSMWVLDAESGAESLHDTNIESLAREHGIYKEEARYVPQPYIVGTGDLYGPIEESLLSAGVDEEREVDIPPDKGEGDWDPSKVQIFPMRRVASLPQYRKEGTLPQVGDSVLIDGRAGQILAVIAGRVRVDFNPPLSGKHIRFRYRITETAEDVETRLRMMIDMVYKYSEDFRISEKDGSLEIVLPEVCKYDPGWSLSKMKLMALVREHTGFTTIRLIEEWVTPSKGEEGAPSEKEEGGG